MFFNANTLMQPKNKKEKVTNMNNCDTLRDMVPFVQFKKREKQLWGSATLLKVALIHGCFRRFLNCTNDTKSRKASQPTILESTNLMIILPRNFFYEE